MYFNYYKAPPNHMASEVIKVAYTLVPSYICFVSQTSVFGTSTCTTIQITVKLLYMHDESSNIT